ncbi:MAG: MFS transporter, partial [Bdellovibrionales bacterium]|nr:MFS transporter [Bdellovibrionales bacterium]
GKEDLLNAVALNSSIFHAARVVGPAIGGLIVAAAGEGVCFSLNALSYLAVIAGLLSIQTRETIAKNPEGSTPLSRIQEGVAFAWHKRPIRALLCLVGFVSLVGMPYIVLMPIFAEKVLHSGSHGFGLLVASSGIGAMLGALYLAARRGTDGLGNLLVTGTLLFGIFLIAFSQSGHLWLSVALIIPSGATMMCVLASSNTLLQIMVSDELRGRVMSVYAMMFMGSAPLSSLISGALAEHIGAPWTVTLGGICTVLGGCALWKILPPLQSEAQQLILAQQMVGGHPGDEVSESWGQSNISYSLDKEQE